MLSSQYSAIECVDKNMPVRQKKKLDLQKKKEKKITALSALSFSGWVHMSVCSHVCLPKGTANYYLDITKVFSLPQPPDGHIVVREIIWGKKTSTVL